MSRCKICGWPIRSCEVIHSDCREKWEAEIREAIEKDLEIRAATIREREKELSEREENLQKREENVLDRENDLVIKEAAEEIRAKMLDGLLEESGRHLKNSQRFLNGSKILFIVSAAVSVVYVAWIISKLV